MSMEQAPMMSTGWGQQQMSPNLAGAVEYHVRRGWRVESAPMPGQVVVVHGKRPNHVLHLLLSVFTLGLWLLVWLVVAASAKETRAVLTVQRDGSVSNSIHTQLAESQPWYLTTEAFITFGVLSLFVLAAIWLG